jgi:hypothetical protein
MTPEPLPAVRELPVRPHPDHTRQYRLRRLSEPQILSTPQLRLYPYRQQRSDHSMWTVVRHMHEDTIGTSASTNAEGGWRGLDQGAGRRNRISKSARLSADKIVADQLAQAAFERDVGTVVFFARPRQFDPDEFLDAPGPARHHRDAIG